MTEQRITIRDRTVRYREAGRGQPVLLAAGLGISADFYRPNLAALARAGYRAIVADSPGAGKTSGPFFGASVAEMADDLTALAAALGIKRAHWLGHSIGCQVVLEIAARRPDLARSLVLAGPTGGYDRRLLHQMGALAYHATHEPWRLMKAVLRDYVRLSPFNYVGTWIKAGREDPLLSAARARCPALILIGTEDRVPPREFLAQLAQKLDDAEIVRIAGGQHGLPLDSQEQFERAVISFLRAN